MLKKKTECEFATLSVEGYRDFVCDLFLSGAQLSPGNRVR